MVWYAQGRDGEPAPQQVRSRKEACTNDAKTLWAGIRRYKLLGNGCLAYTARTRGQGQSLWCPMPCCCWNSTTTARCCSSSSASCVERYLHSTGRPMVRCGKRSRGYCRTSAWCQGEVQLIMTVQRITGGRSRSCRVFASCARCTQREASASCEKSVEAWNFLKVLSPCQMAVLSWVRLNGVRSVV